MGTERKLWPRAVRSDLPGRSSTPEVRAEAGGGGLAGNGGQRKTIC